MQVELSTAELHLICEAVEQYFYDFKESVDSGEIADGMTGSMGADLEYAAELADAYNQLESLYDRVSELQVETYIPPPWDAVASIVVPAEEQASHEISHTCDCPFCGIAR